MQTNPIWMRHDPAIREQLFNQGVFEISVIVVGASTVDRHLHEELDRMVLTSRSQTNMNATFLFDYRLESRCEYCELP
jgi:hypothetical protein